MGQYVIPIVAPAAFPTFRIGTPGGYVKCQPARAASCSSPTAAGSGLTCRPAASAVLAVKGSGRCAGGVGPSHLPGRTSQVLGQGQRVQQFNNLCGQADTGGPGAILDV